MDVHFFDSRAKLWIEFEAPFKTYDIARAGNISEKVMPKKSPDLICHVSFGLGR